MGPNAKRREKESTYEVGRADELLLLLLSILLLANLTLFSWYPIPLIRICKVNKLHRVHGSQIISV